MGWVSDFTTYLGLGEEIASIFTGGDDVGALESFLENMFATLLSEIEQVFEQDLTNNLAATATGVAQTAKDFLAVDYVNAQRAGESDAQLWTLLSADTSGPSLQALSAQASTMTTWTQYYPTMAQMAQQTVSLALTIYSLIVALRRERAMHAPDPPTRAAETASMRTYAGLGVSRIQPLLDSVTQQRVAAISPLTEGSWSATGPAGARGGRAEYERWYFVTDSWSTNSTPQSTPSTPRTVLTVYTSGLGDGPAAETVRQMQLRLTEARQLYVNLAQGGSDGQMTQWQQQLTNLVNTDNYFQFPPDNTNGVSPSAPGLARALSSLTPVGSWLYQGRTTLQSLTGLSLNGVAFVYGPYFGGTTASIARFPIGPDGQLSPGTSTALPLVSGSYITPGSVVFSPDRKYAYLAVVNQLPSVPAVQVTLNQYATAADMTLSPAPVSQVVLSPSPGLNSVHMTLSPDGRNAYAAATYSPNFGPDAVYQYSVAADGSLSPKTPPSVTTPAPGTIAISADGKHAYVTNYQGNTVTHFPIATDGTLSAGSATTVPGGWPNGRPFYIMLSPDGKSAYVGNHPDSSGLGSVSQYSVAPDGTLSRKAPASIVTGEGTNQIAIRRDGLSAYVAAGNNTVLQYSIAADGTLSPKSPPSVTTGFNPSAIALSDDNRCAYVTDYQSMVWQYSIASDGTLSPMTPATVAPVPPPPQSGTTGYPGSITVLPPTIL